MLSEMLRDVAARLYPSVTLSQATRFLPMIHIERGDISSTAAVEIARATRSRAEAIAAQIIDELKGGSPGSWRSDLGYIVLAGAPFNILAHEARTLREAFPARPPGAALRDIVALSPDVTVPLYARLRLAALAGVQALMAVTYEGPCRLTLVPRPGCVVSSAIEVMQEVRAAVELLAAEEPVERREVRGLLDSVSAGRCTVFTAHHYHDALPAPSKSYLGDLKMRETINLRMPADSWLISRERALPELLSASSLRGVLKQLSSDDAWMRWLFHAASSIPSGDFDPMVALFDECASPLWSARVLAERFEWLTGRRIGETDRSALESLSSVELPQRPLLVRAIFLPVWLQRAVCEGDVAACMTVLEQFSAASHAFLNRPDTRRALSQVPISGSEEQILAGLSFGLSSILPVVSGGGHAAINSTKH